MSSEPKQIKKLYYSIGEVSKMTELKAYVLRYWETEFKQLKPPKNRAGNRTYRQSDIDLILYIKDLLYNQKFTIEGSRHQLANEKNSKKEDVAVPVESVQQAAPARKETLLKIKQELETLLEILRR
jgi:DNA-binding transcriptional MerR regulator